MQLPLDTRYALQQPHCQRRQCRLGVNGQQPIGCQAGPAAAGCGARPRGSTLPPTWKQACTSVSRRRLISGRDLHGSVLQAIGSPVPTTADSSHNNQLVNFSVAISDQHRPQTSTGHRPAQQLPGPHLSRRMLYSSAVSLGSRAASAAAGGWEEGRGGWVTLSTRSACSGLSQGRQCAGAATNDSNQRTRANRRIAQLQRDGGEAVPTNPTQAMCALIPLNTHPPARTARARWWRGCRQTSRTTTPSAPGPSAPCCS